MMGVCHPGMTERALVKLFQQLCDTAGSDDATADDDDDDGESGGDAISKEGFATLCIAHRLYPPIDGGPPPKEPEDVCGGETPDAPSDCPAAASVDVVSSEVEVEAASVTATAVNPSP